MRVSALLRELNIALGTLRSYEPFLEDTDYKFNVVNQLVPDHIYKKVLEFHHSKANNFEMFVFQDNENYRYIAKIKWYNRNQVNIKIGLIEKRGLPSVVFDKLKFSGISDFDSVDNIDIITTVKIDEANQETDTIQAVSLNTINNEVDVAFLVFQFSHNFSNLLLSTGDKIIERLRKLNYIINEKDAETLNNNIETQLNLLFLKNGSLQLQLKLEQLLEFSITSKLNTNIFIVKLKENHSLILFKLWLKNLNFDVEISYLKNHIIKSICDNVSESEMIFERLSNGNSIELIIDLFLEDNIDKINKLYEILEKKENGLNLFLGKISTLNPRDIFKIWLNTEKLRLDFDILNIDNQSFINCFIEYINDNPSLLNTLINRLEIEQKQKVLNFYINNSESIDYALLVNCIKILKENKLPIAYNLIANDIIIKLWFNNEILDFPIEAFFKVIKENCFNYFRKKDEEEIVKNTRELLRKLSDSELINVFAKIDYEKDNFDERTTFNLYHFMLINLIETIGNSKKTVCSENVINDCMSDIFDKSSDYYRLKLFLLDYTEVIDFNDVVIYTGLLSSNDQKLFFKKVLKLISEQKTDVSLEDLNRITTIDYQTSEYAKEIDGVGLDFTLSVILKLITDLKNKIRTSRTSIFDLVANQIKTPKDLLVIDGFFEKCSGKTIIEENGTKKLENGTSETIYKTTKKEHFLPRFSAFCDGKKAVIKGSTEPILCNKSGLEFWWCENSQCYDVCRKPHATSQWKNYTLEDVLQILKIPYEVTQYEILLNVINRVNRFLSHLTCRKCNSILKPKGISNYAFYGVTMFSCNNKNCEEHSKEIYLSHCLNGKCEDIIDSRDSVKCKTANFGEECGWYICKNCNACCSSEKLVARKSNLETLNREYNCHIEGHRDRGIICCSDCGHEMFDPTTNELFNKQLNWFVEHKDSHPNIINSGKRIKDNKWWFIWARGNMSFVEYNKQIQSLFSSGFTIPDFDDKEKENQLIAEPIDKVFVCPNCDLHFDLNNMQDFDYGKKIAIQKFHTIIFPQINNKQ